jgi:hypothetical protein
MYKIVMEIAEVQMLQMNVVSVAVVVFLRENVTANIKHMIVKVLAVVLKL